MKFSIAVPSLNQGQFIDSCLRSIAAQSFSDLETLIADGGSTDDSLDAIAAITRHDHRFQLVSTTDAGQADAVVRAFSCASGDILCFLNADDVYLNADVLQRVHDEFVRHPEVDVLIGGGVYLDEQGRPIKRVRPRYHPLDDLTLMRRRTAVLQPAAFWRSHVMNRISLRTDAEFSFDSWFFYDAWQQGYRFHEYDGLLAGYRLHGRNKSTRICPQRIEELARFEDHKFGQGCFRGRYLRFLRRVVDAIESLPFAVAPIKRVFYLSVNSLSFATTYHLPGI
jgi:glycosyltransferase involved in cell wall biosynthesis